MAVPIIPAIVQRIRAMLPVSSISGSSTYQTIILYRKGHRSFPSKRLPALGNCLVGSGNAFLGIGNCWGLLSNCRNACPIEERIP